MVGEEGENENSIVCMSFATIYVAHVECDNNIRKKQVFHFRSQNIMARIFYFMLSYYEVFLGTLSAIIIQS